MAATATWTAISNDMTRFGKDSACDSDYSPHTHAAAKDAGRRGCAQRREPGGRRARSATAEGRRRRIRTKHGNQRDSVGAPARTRGCVRVGRELDSPISAERVAEREFGGERTTTARDAPVADARHMSQAVCRAWARVETASMLGCTSSPFCCSSSGSSDRSCRVGSSRFWCFRSERSCCSSRSWRA